MVAFCVSQSQAGTDHEADYRALTAAGDYVWIRDVVHVMRDEAGEVQALIGFMFDISERKHAEQKLVELQKQLEEFSYKDGLTGVANRRMVDSTLDVEWANAQRTRQPLSLILLDIDYFKQYNDHYGHIQGDDCLKSVGQALSEAANRPRDLVGRFGGEEFVLILPETDADAARQVAERCRRLLRERCIPTRNPGSPRCSPSASASAPSSPPSTTRRLPSSNPSTACCTGPSRAAATASKPASGPSPRPGRNRAEQPPRLAPSAARPTQRLRPFANELALSALRVARKFQVQLIAELC